MKKYYQVFISSVSNEFKNVRQKVIDGIMRQDRFFPVAMEYMTSHENTIQMLYSYISNSDIYALILGKEYGSKIGITSTLLDLFKKDPSVEKSALKFMKEASIKEYADITFTELEFIIADALGIKKAYFVLSDFVKDYENGIASKETARFYENIRKYNSYNKWSSADELEKLVVNSINKISDELRDTQAGWIRETDSKIYQATHNAGIIDASLDGKFDAKKLERELEKSSTLKIFYTTGARFFGANEELLAKFIARGGIVQLLCSKPDSETLNDVQLIEEAFLGSPRQLIHQEIVTCISTMKNILGSAEKFNNEYFQGQKLGKIQFGFSSSLFRSSILICESSNGAQSWGWLTITLPPYKSKDTVSFEITGELNRKGEHNILISRAIGHFNAVWDLALHRNEIFNITQDFELSKPQKNDPNEYWKKKEKVAIQAMRSRTRCSDILIEVAAQHPLKDGQYPDVEFSARLDTAIEIYNREIAKGKNVEIYVPGSIHLDYEGIADICSLSDAGCQYLIEKGIPKEAVHGEDLNCKYDSKRFYTGVYNTADECYIASQYFNENVRFSRLISVCSPNQLMRKSLFYLEYNILPMIVTVPCEKLSHNFLYELLESTPYVLYTDHDWQDEHSAEAIRTRKERDPRWNL